ncbi:MAG: universal stress protein [Woeseia sp.]|nr:universal stress protein [Woeseia sp.]
MRSFRRILAVVDPTSDMHSGVRKAAGLAKVYQAELTLFASCYYSYLTDIAIDHESAAESFSDATLKDVELRLEKLAESLRATGLNVSCNAEWHRSRHGSILEAAGRLGADLIVKDTHYHTAISRALFTNTDWSLIRESKIPLWLVKKNEDFSKKPRIIVAVDLAQQQDAVSSMDEFLLQAGQELTRALHGRLYAFHAFDLMPMLGSAATRAVKPKRLPLEELRSELRTGRAEALDVLAGGQGISAEYRLLKAGSIVDTLPGTAIEIDASLLVIGAIGSAGTSPQRIGSTAEAVLDHVPCDLLILRPPGGH